MTTLQEIKQAMLHMLFPHVCAGCGSDLVETKNLLCLSCLEALPETQFQHFPSNPVETAFWGRLPVAVATAQYYFTKDSLLQVLMHQLKYRGNRSLGIYLGKMMGRQLRQSSRFDDIDVLVPLPLYASRERKRGYNQAALICKGMAETMQLPVEEKAVIRNQFTASQTKKKRIERWQNMEGKFECIAPEKLANRHILLVDDVITTGATLEACGKELVNIPGLTLSMATLCYASH